MMYRRLVLPLLVLPFSLSLPRPAMPSPAAPPPATAKPVAPRERFEDTSQVLAVEVPVNVTSRDGQSVRGLKPEDFEVLDEGTAQPITGFEVIDLETLPQGGVSPAVPAPPAAPGASAPAAGSPAVPAGNSEQLAPSARRHFLLLFDLSFSNPIAVLKARLAARDFLLHSLKPADLAAVATFSIDSGPRLVVTFTPDRAQLARGIDTLGTRKLSQLVDRIDPLRFVIEDPISQTVGGVRGQNDNGNNNKNSDADQRADLKTQSDSALLENLKAIQKAADRDQTTYERNRVKALVRSMGDMAQALSSVKGRKYLIYFSEGFDSRLLLGRAPGGQDTEEENTDIMQGHHERVDLDNRYGNTELQSTIDYMLERFRRADCVIQAVDIGGLRAGADMTGTIRNSGQDSLFYMANETGGELFKDANNLRGQLDRVLSRTSVTYLLTFQRSDLKLDGAYHRLRVKVRTPGARVSYRTGYYAPRPFKELDPLERNLLAADGIASAAPRHDLDLSLLVTSFRANKDRAYVPVIIEAGGKSLLAGQHGDKMNVEFYTYVTDARGEMKDFFTQMVGFDLTKGRQAMEETGVKYYGHLELPPGQYRVRVLVRNAETGRTGIETATLSIPTYETAQPDLLPPLFFETPGRWLLVRERPKQSAPGQEPGSVVYPFTVNGVPYVPAAKPALGSADKAKLCLVAYNMGGGNLAVDGEVLSAGGQVLPGGQLSLVERTATGIAGVDKLLATFEPKGLPAGDYVLRVAVSNKATGDRRMSSVPFIVN
ncbi:MAG TPA: VWA domain-containing protein [Thermoanaerobaculia bacterium]|nr:VWA domain-containing protein [Thermoanaerobaculia bacterium]